MRSNGPSPPEWRTHPLRDVAEIFDGPHATPRKITNGPIFLGIKSLRNGRLDLSGTAHLSEQDFAKWTRRVVPRPGDVVFSYETRLGEAALVPEGIRCCLGRRMGLLRPNPKLVADRFLLYAYLGPQFQSVLRERTIHGSTVDRIPLTEMGSFPLLLPSPEEQRRITGVLGVLDDKVEANRRLVETLEAIAAALFRAQFVDFVGMEEFDDSEIGPVPRGWSSVPVADLARYVNGKAFTKLGNGRGRMVVRIAELRSGPGAATVYTDHETDAQHMAQPGDILFAWSGSLDVYRWHREEALINQHIFKVIPQGYPGWFVYQALKHVMPEFRAIAADKATTMGHIKRSNLAEFAVAVPPPGDLAPWDAVFGPAFDRSLEAKVESETLTVLRDALLPELISGKIRVPDTYDPDEALGPAIEAAAA